MERPALSMLTLPELEKKLYPFPRFHAAQILNWTARGVSDFDQMTDIPLSLRDMLKKNFRIFSSAIVSCHDDNDAKKIVISLKDNSKIESVLLNDGKNRFTACLSTQAGCPIGCVFCKTGALGFKRNLESYEIIEQFIFLRGTALNVMQKDTENSDKQEHIIDNIVIMGMGEPLLNLAQLKKAIEFFTNPAGMNFSKRRITISTCGICNSLFDIAQNGPYVRLALSLVTADEILREKLMPVTKTNPLQKVKEGLILYQKKTGSRVTLEIPLLGGINTREKDALSAADFAKGMDTVVNIIPWNPVEGLEFEDKQLVEPEKREIENFISKLESNGLKVTKRLRKGRGIMGACGQLGA